jgi:hypothetical protein
MPRPGFLAMKKKRETGSLPRGVTTRKGAKTKGELGAASGLGAGRAGRHGSTRGGKPWATSAKSGRRGQ